MITKDKHVFSVTEDLKEDFGKMREQYESTDFFRHAKKHLLILVKKLSKEEISSRIDSSLKDVRQCYNDLLEEERAAVLEEFKTDGGEEKDFDMRLTDVDVELQEVLKNATTRLKVWQQASKKQARDVLSKQHQLLDALRSLMDETDIQNSFSAFKKIQIEWAQMGRIAGTQSKALWASYHALVDRFYDQKNIYFELKELDRKKNLEQKLLLCEKVETLAETDNIKTAIEKLKEAHYKFKNIGPVPTQEMEKTWLRFKTASDAVRLRWNDYLKKMRQELKANKEKKEKLIKDMESLGSFESKKIVEWHRKTKDIVALRRQWENIGPVPREHASELSKQFWPVYQNFFRQKRKFSKELEGDREENLKRKEELLQQINDLKKEANEPETLDIVKKIQRDWNAIGPVPESQADKITNEFRSTADSFFERHREQLKEQKAKEIENFDKKIALCKEIKELSKAKATSLSPLNDVVERYNLMGGVLDVKSDELEIEFNQAIASFFESFTGLEEKEKKWKKIEIQLSALQHDPKKRQKIEREEQAIRKKMRQEEREIAVFENNLEFFGRSKSSEKLKNDLSKKLEKGLDHLNELKAHLKLLKAFYKNI